MSPLRSFIREETGGQTSPEVLGNKTEIVPGVFCSRGRRGPGLASRFPCPQSPGSLWSRHVVGNVGSGCQPHCSPLLPGSSRPGSQGRVCSDSLRPSGVTAWGHPWMSLGPYEDPPESLRGLAQSSRPGVVVTRVQTPGSGATQRRTPRIHNFAVPTLETPCPVGRPGPKATHTDQTLTV